MFPQWFSLLHERLHAFFLIFAGKACVQQAPLKMHPLGQGGFKGVIDRFFIEPDGYRRKFGDLPGDLQCFV
ncbi:hypothetical protein D3C85_1920070 [compost metagenome]